jgi:transaldolase
MTSTEEGYFHRVARHTPTEFWINNPTLAEAGAALEAGAVGATTNPAYLARLLTEEPDYVAQLIDETLQENDNEERAADLVYQKAVARLQRRFEPVYARTHGRFGYVAIQGDPRVNTDVSAILEGAVRYRQLGDNIIIKVPSWPAGALALRELVAMEVPTIATLGFSVDQAVFMADAFRRGLKHSKARPVCYVTFIAGVLETFLAGQSTELGTALSSDLIQQAGCAATRVAYDMCQSRGYEARLMGGGARSPDHFLELVGGDMAVTIGWGIAQQIIDTNAPIVSRIGARTREATVSILEAGLPDFQRSYRPQSLEPEEFHDFGPVAAFQNSFLTGFSTLLSAVTARRSALPALHDEGSAR